MNNAGLAGTRRLRSGRAFPAGVSIILLALGIGLRGQLGKAVRASGRVLDHWLDSAASVPQAPRSAVLWSADMETGDLSQWSLPDLPGGPNSGGGVFNSGISAATVDAVIPAHSGMYSAKLFIEARGRSDLPTSGARVFRWREPQEHSELFYSVWYYFPRRYQPNGNPSWWNIFQWKSKHYGASVSDPFFTLNVGNRPDGSMYLYLYDQKAMRTITQTLKDIPEARWFRVEAFYRCAADQSGRIDFWQDGTAILSIAGAQTRYVDGDCEWSVNNYTDSLESGSAIIYVDDAAICSGGRCPQ